jgi:hypothetical protein
VREEKDSFIKKWIDKNWEHPAFCTSGECDASKIQEEWLELHTEIASLRDALSDNKKSFPAERE